MGPCFLQLHLTSFTWAKNMVKILLTKIAQTLTIITQN